jgi:hypothetical protein
MADKKGRSKKIFVSDVWVSIDGEERLGSLLLTEKELTILRTLESKGFDGMLLSELAKKHGNYVYRIIYDMARTHIVDIAYTEKYGRKRVAMITELGKNVLQKASQ